MSNTTQVESLAYTLFAQRHNLKLHDWLLKLARKEVQRQRTADPTAYTEIMAAIGASLYNTSIENHTNPQQPHPQPKSNPQEEPTQSKVPQPDNGALPAHHKRTTKTCPQCKKAKGPNAFQTLTEGGRTNDICRQCLNKDDKTPQSTPQSTTITTPLQPLSEEHRATFLDRVEHDLNQQNSP